MPQLAPRSLDWYRATYVHERLAVHRAAAAVGTPPAVDAAQGARRLVRWRAVAPLNAEEWWSQGVSPPCSPWLPLSPRADGCLEELHAHAYTVHRAQTP